MYTPSPLKSQFIKLKLFQFRSRVRLWRTNWLSLRIFETFFISAHNFAYIWSNITSHESLKVAEGLLTVKFNRASPIVGQEACKIRKIVKSKLKLGYRLILAVPIQVT